MSRRPSSDNLEDFVLVSLNYDQLSDLLWAITRYLELADYRPLEDEELGLFDRVENYYIPWLISRLEEFE